MEPNTESKWLDSSVETEVLTINMGPQHPSTHGVLHLLIQTDGEIVKSVDPDIGFLHRNFEKHCEFESYPQIIPYVDRIDYLAAMNCELGYVLTIEKLLELEIPDRVHYIRIIMAELNRIASHLVAIGTYGLDIGTFTPFLWCFRDREYILDLFELNCGGRLLYNYIWIGGVSHDLHPKFIEKLTEFLDHIEKQLPEFDTLLTDNLIFIKRTANIGVLPPEIAIRGGATGPMLRGSGIQWDIRKGEPYSIYDRFDFDIPVGQGLRGTLGDCWDRFWVRMQEVKQSIRILRRAIKELPAGDVHAALPRKVRTQVGEAYMRTEAPRGELGFHVISDGSDKPFRLKCRSPGFCNLSLLKDISKGAMISDAVVIVGSIDIVLGEVDR